jgi:tRNA(Ser,Leu) C12 N-acetylase TAN1
MNTSIAETRLLEALEERGEQGLTKTAIRREVFSAHMGKDELDAMVHDLVDRGEITADRDLRVKTRKLGRIPLLLCRAT